MGRRNTARILAIDSSAPAARACADFRGGGFNDWFLPSRDELNQLYINRNHVGNLVTSGNPPRPHYWSSSQGGFLSSAGAQFFRDGIYTDQMAKSQDVSVRAVRAF